MSVFQSLFNSGVFGKIKSYKINKKKKIKRGNKQDIPDFDQLYEGNKRMI